MDDKQKEVFSNGFIDMFRAMFTQSIEFNFLMKNHNDWDRELPQRLANQKVFIVAVKDQIYVDSYIHENGDIVLVTVFDDNKYSKILNKEDIQGFMTENNTPLLMKPFEETAPVRLKARAKKFSIDDLDKEALSKSMSIMVSNNPSFFKQD